MKFTFTTDNLATLASDCLVIAVHDDSQLSQAAQTVDEASDGFIKKVVEQGDFTGKLEQTLLLHQVPNITASRVLLVGCGKDLDPTKFHKLLTSTLAVISKLQAANVAFALLPLEVAGRDINWQTYQTALMTANATYQFNQLKSEKKPAPSLESISFALPAGTDTASLEQNAKLAAAVAKGMNLTKDLGNLPSNICTPTYLAEQAQQLANDFASINTEVLEEQQMRELGMGSFLSVSQGSDEPGKMISMHYQGGKQGDAPVVIVGKGITFDTGGISIKPSSAMDEMKYDMCGAASVFGVIKAIAEFQLPLNVIGVVAAAENMPGGKASKPGDIVTSMSGQTIEILNTDAEGRLVLCDALTYSEKFNPTCVIDVATLTGAMVIALGEHTTGMMSNNEELAHSLIDAGNESFDRIWQMPVWEEYQSKLDSNFADMANCGDRAGGSITAACFLARFTKKYPWAHLDIAGTAWVSGKAKGATGRPVPALVQFLVDRVK